MLSSFYYLSNVGGLLDCEETVVDAFNEQVSYPFVLLNLGSII